jgi:phenylacetate-CoA ligase
MHLIGEENLSLAQIKALQTEAWAKTYRYVCARSPFYQQHFRQAGLLATSPPQLSRIPPIDKQVLSENSDAFLCVPRKRIVDVVSTSGTTGKPLVYYLTELDLQRLAVNEYHSFRCAGFTDADTVLLGVTLDRGFIAGMAYALGLRRLGCAVVRIGAATPAMHLDMLQRVEATALVGVPSFLSLLAHKAAESGLDLRPAQARKLVCIGEPIRHPDLTLNRAGQFLAERWQASLYSTYGVTELAASLCECEAGSGGHLHPESLYLEALDEAGNPVSEGQPGEITATTFGVEAMPLIRYRTGDYAALYRGRCTCGRHTLRLGPVVGRKSQKLKLKGTTLFPSTLQSVLDSVPEVAAYAIIARRQNELSDLVEVRVACQGEVARTLRTLEERFQGEAKVRPEISFASAAEIEALQLPEGTRKRRIFVDLRA